jgi:hypothetical protein
MLGFFPLGKITLGFWLDKPRPAAACWKQPLRQQKKFLQFPAILSNKTHFGE